MLFSRRAVVYIMWSAVYRPQQHHFQHHLYHLRRAVVSIVRNAVCRPQQHHYQHHLDHLRRAVVYIVWNALYRQQLHHKGVQGRSNGRHSRYRGLLKN